jgi:hypothetical protein
VPNLISSRKMNNAHKLRPLKEELPQQPYLYRIIDGCLQRVALSTSSLHSSCSLFLVVPHPKDKQQRVVAWYGKDARRIDCLVGEHCLMIDFCVCKFGRLVRSALFFCTWLSQNNNWSSICTNCAAPQESYQATLQSRLCGSL